MKSILRSISLYSFSLFVVTILLDGVKVTGGIWSFIVAGAILTLLFWVVKPIVSLITFPLSFITLGLFSFITNALMLYLLTILAPNISIQAFTFPGLSFWGFVIPPFFLNTFFAFIVSALLLSFIKGFLIWLIER